MRARARPRPARLGGAPARHLRREEPQHPGRAGAERTAGDQRSALRAEIADLDRELAKLDPLGSLDVPPSNAAPRLLSADELARVRDDLAERVRELRRELGEYRAEQLAAELEEEEAQRARQPRWHHAGVWTGGPAMQVSWTTP